MRTAPRPWTAHGRPPSLRSPPHRSVCRTAVSQGSSSEKRRASLNYANHDNSSGDPATSRRVLLVAAAAAAPILVPSAAKAYNAPGFDFTVSDSTPAAGAPFTATYAGAGRLHADGDQPGRRGRGPDRERRAHGFTTCRRDRRLLSELAEATRPARVGLPTMR